MRQTIPAAIVMITYAVVVLFIGWITFSVAPPGSNAITALVVSLVAALLMTACAVLTILGRSNRRLGMIGIHVGLVIPLIVAVGPALRLRGSLEKAHAFNAALREGPVIVARETMKEKAAPHPVAYQSVGLGAIAAVSFFGFVSILMLRPKPEKNDHPRAEPAPGLDPAPKIETP